MLGDIDPLYWILFAVIVWLLLMLRRFSINRKIRNAEKINFATTPIDNESDRPVEYNKNKYIKGFIEGSLTTIMIILSVLIINKYLI